MPLYKSHSPRLGRSCYLFIVQVRNLHIMIFYHQRSKESTGMFSKRCATLNGRRTGSRISGVRSAPHVDAATADRRPDSEHLRISQGPAPALVVWWWRCRSATWGKHMPRGRFNRRDLISGLAVAASVWPLAARAQQPGKTPRVGYIRAGTPHNDPFREEFARGMRDLGYVEGRNIAYEFRHYGDDVESIPSLIGDLLRAKVDIIVVGGTAAIRAAQRATQSIPIVMGAAADPLESGLIAGLARPGGNITGLSVMSTELTVKRLELLKEVMPQAVRIAILQQPANPAHSLFIKEVEPIAGALGLTYRVLQVHGLGRFRAEFRVNAGVAGRCRLRAGRCYFHRFSCRDGGGGGAPPSAADLRGPGDGRGGLPVLLFG